MTRFVYEAVTVQFNTDPVRPLARSLNLGQVREVDSDGNIVVYGKGAQAAIYALTFPRVTAAVKAALIIFARQQLRGVRNLFTWYDHAETARTVRLVTSSLHFIPVGPDAYRLDIQLEETL